MGWFDEQIRQRKENEECVLSEAVYNVTKAVSGEKHYFNIKANQKTATNAVDEILKFYHLKTRDLPGAIKETEDQLEYLLRPHGIMRRRVELKKGWHKDATAPMLATRKGNGSFVALIPCKNGGYIFDDYETGKSCKVTRQNEELFESEAICFYKPFPGKILTKKELTSYILKTIPKIDLVYFVLITFVAVLIGLIVPAIYKLLLETVVYQSDIAPLLAATVFLISVTIGAGVFSAVKRLMIAKIKNEMKISVEAATMMRILSLPVSFFKNYSSGELSNRVQSVGLLCETIADSVLGSGLTSVFSLMFILQIYIFAPSLFVISICIMIAHLFFSVVCGILQTKVKRKQVKYSDKEQGISYALISGVQKIKLAGAEKRASSKWANAYAKTASAMYNPPFVLKIKNAVSTAIALLGGICIYFAAVKNNVNVADYYAFNSAYAIASVAFFNFVEIMMAFAEAKSKIEDINLFFETEPEISSEKQVISRISGGIELCNVSFKYSDEMSDVIDDISLKISPGQYVAIVGKTGCGKSTLMRLMLGLEKPRKGAIYYDNKDIDKIDLKSLRKKIGVVMQDGKLFHGDILSNITITSSEIPIEKVWEAAEIAGIADDIKKMPMGIKTIINEGSRGISGGQKQRILIARAIASNPKILMFDEATSALDNVTQKKVADSLEGLDCTRIVIAHRLSTIKQCNRIIVLDKGKIAEDGTYDELMRKNGLFAELVSRQKID